MTVLRHFSRACACSSIAAVLGPAPVRRLVWVASGITHRHARSLSGCQPAARAWLGVSSLGLIGWCRRAVGMVAVQVNGTTPSTVMLRFP
ncbi:hypothetical protein [Streptomyces sp. NPDC048419]|uniref:hypothetical protein n=1 Tax=Streptomyces sp. NPDC048419 TaxID=3365547 RepID=UPI00371253BA